VHDLPGIKRVRGKIFAQRCEVEVELLPGRDRDQMLALIHGRIQAIPRLPKELEAIEVAMLGREGDDGVIWVALHGDTDAFELQQFGEGIQQQLATIPGVSLLRKYGEIGYELAIEVSPERLRKYRLTLDEVAQAVRAAPGGLIKNPDGNHLRLAQVVTIRDGLEERLFTWRHNGQTAQGWEVHTESDSVQVASQVKATIESIRAGLPEGLRLICWWDDSQAYDERIATLLEDGLGGFVLVCLVLTLFLRARVALWAVVGILTSVLGAFCLMPLLGISLNMLSLFGFLLAMGVLVGDAIIIGESIHSRQVDAGETPLPVTLSVLGRIGGIFTRVEFAWLGRSDDETDLHDHDFDLDLFRGRSLVDIARAFGRAGPAGSGANALAEAKKPIESGTGGFRRQNLSAVAGDCVELALPDGGAVCRLADNQLGLGGRRQRAAIRQSGRDQG